MKSKHYSKYIGVHFRDDVGKFRAFISINRKLVHIGYFASDIDAAKKYDEFVINNKLDRKLNFPKINELLPDGLKHIKLSKGLFCIVDQEDFEELNKYSWSLDSRKNINYAVSVIKLPDNTKKRIRMHVLVFEMHNLNKDKLIIDHVNHNGLHNYKSNLRSCSYVENIRNSRKHNIKATSKFKGVIRIGNNRFISSMKIDGKLVKIGKFTSEVEAAKAYDAAAKKYFGEFAYLNFPDK